MTNAKSGASTNGPANEIAICDRMSALAGTRAPRLDTLMISREPV
jgi:hypothetical protein